MINIHELTQQDINDGLIKVKDAIVAEPNRINMRSVVGDLSVTNIHDCNTPMCIGGWLATILDNCISEPDIYKTYCKLNNGCDEYMPLNYLFNNYPINTPTPQQACQAIDNYIAGNYQNPWDGVE